MNTPTLTRRAFIQHSALLGGGLTLALTLGETPAFGADPAPASSTPADFTPNLFIRIATDGTITLLATNPECGQGVKTSFPMLIAEELEVDWKQIRITQADFNPALGRQVAGGSGGTPALFKPYLLLGATARTLLLTAAAQNWSVPVAECSAASATVTHKPTGRTLTYAQLAAASAKLPVPDEKSVSLKNPADYKLLGTRISGIDNPALVTGKPLFGIDQKFPGQLYATYEKCPTFGGKATAANLDEVKKLPGVRDAFILEGGKNATGLLSGVAIVATSTWAAFSARRQLRVTWDHGSATSQNTTDYLAQAAKLLPQPPVQSIRKDGDPAATLASAKNKITATYHYPFMSHANLEPQNCTAHWRDGVMEIWAPTQNPSPGRDLVADTLKIPKDKITIHMLRIGGGFGRRLMNDYMVEVAAIAQRVPAPVKLTWTREDDMRHDFYRPGGHHQLTAALADDGQLLAWHNHFVTYGSKNKPGGGADLRETEFPGGFIPHFESGLTVLDTTQPMGPWRAPGSCSLAWVYQCFIDELAHAAKQDPVQFRLNLLAAKKSGAYDADRMSAVVKLAAEKSGWGRALPRGQGLGIAFHFSHRGYFAEVAEVNVSKEGLLKVAKVWCVGDVGHTIVNLSGAENQVEGSIVDGFSAAWNQEITLDQGRVSQSNFTDYQLLRIADAPAVETHFLRSKNNPTGLGEPALPPAAPAICNAIFAATGKRIRSLPLARADLSWS